jgi:hypothetical protein
VKVYSNDSSKPTLDIKIKADVNKQERIFRWDPEIADFGKIVAGGKGELIIGLTNADSAGNNIIIVEKPSDKYIEKFKIDKTKLKPESSTRIDLSTRNDLKPGNYTTSITLEARDSINSRITIPIRFTIVARKT